MLRGRFHPVFPGVSGSQRFGVHNNSLVNGCRALVERVFLSPDGNGELIPPPPCAAEPMKTLRGFATAVGRFVGVHRRISAQEFLGYYHGRRRQCYERAVASLDSAPITVRDFGVRNAFVKAEKTNFTAKPDPAPRIIQPRDPRYNVEVGRYLRHLEHPIYDAIASIYGGPTVMKGYTAAGVAGNLREMWGQFSTPVAIGLDASRFDQHVRPQMLEWEHSVYVGCYAGRDAEHLAWLLRGQIHNRCTMRCQDGVAKYTVDGSRMSGDMNTALGNCLIMTALVHRLAAERGVRVRLANNGDDCVVIMEHRDLHRFSDGLREWFKAYGFNMKVEDPVLVFERIEFCQAHPVFDGESWIMVRNPQTCMSKDGCCVVKDYGWGSAARSWLAAVGECGMSMCGGIPVLQHYYQAFIDNGSKVVKDLSVVRETGMYMLSKGLTRQFGDITDDARVSFYFAFGISPTHQRELESRLTGVVFDCGTSPCIAPHGAHGLIPI